MIGVVASRWLGLRCLEELARHTGRVWVHWQERDVTHPGDPDGEEAHARIAELGFAQTDVRSVLESSELVFNILGSHVYTAQEMALTDDIVNLHCAPLPGYRGCHSQRWALANGDAYYAVTLHLIDEGIDTGPIIAQKWLPCYERDSVTDLYRRSQVAALDLFTDTVRDLLDHRYRPRAQNETRARYYTKGMMP